MKKKSFSTLLAGAAALALAGGFLVGRGVKHGLFSNGVLSFWGGVVLLGIGLWLLIRSFAQKQKITKAPEMAGLLDEEQLNQTLKAVKKANPKVFKKEMRELDNQCLRMEKKSEQLDQALKSYFDGSRISYAKFAGTINRCLNLFDENVTQILNRIAIFDEDGYEHLFKTHQEYTDAIEPYQETFDAIGADLKNNEEILSRFDRLLQEVNNLSNPNANLEDLPAMQELGELIDQTKLYRQQH
ncbi:hypothetical protein IM774_00530 [Erysipelotrichaceae bacterium RD49]|nr:hypothetical protein [Erysipelotrichaceae bacterium RD49]